MLLKVAFDGEQASFQIQGVKRGFRKQQVDTTLDQRRDLLVVRIDVLVKGHGPIARVVHFGRNRGRFGGWADRASHESGPLGSPNVELVHRFPSTGGRCQIDFADHFRRQIEFFHPNRAGPKRVGFDNVCSRLQILAVDLRHGFRTSQAVFFHKDLKIFVVPG